MELLVGGAIVAGVYYAFGDNDTAPSRPNMGTVSLAPAQVDSSHRTVGNTDRFGNVSGMPSRTPFESCLTNQAKWTSSALLPSNANVDNQFNIPVPDNLQNKNFLKAGFHHGINTQGSSLRNANYQLRSDPCIPRVNISPWLNSTIDPDLGRRKLDIGGRVEDC